MSASRAAAGNALGVLSRGRDVIVPSAVAPAGGPSSARRPMHSSMRRHRRTPPERSLEGDLFRSCWARGEPVKPVAHLAALGFVSYTFLICRVVLCRFYTRRVHVVLSCFAVVNSRAQ